VAPAGAQAPSRLARRCLRRLGQQPQRQADKPYFVRYIDVTCLEVRESLAAAPRRLASKPKLANLSCFMVRMIDRPTIYGELLAPSHKYGLQMQTFCQVETA